MKFREINKTVSAELKVPYSVVAPIAQKIFDTIILEISKDKEINIHWFGKFSITNRKAKNWINPRTLEPMVIPSRNTLKFTVSTVIKNIINL